MSRQYLEPVENTSLEWYRRNTLEKNADALSPKLIRQLANAGFYYDNDGKIKCFVCSGEYYNDNIQRYISNVNCQIMNVLKFHYFINPTCPFVMHSLSPNTERYKKFRKVASLRYEKARLDTFIDWPMFSIFSPSQLASNGFYYLKKHDFCACAFCRNIIGHWEPSDTPATEHYRHRQGCSFMNGSVFHNVTLKESVILDTINVNKEDYSEAKYDDSPVEESHDLHDLYLSNLMTKFKNHLSEIDNNDGDELMFDYLENSVKVLTAEDLDNDLVISQLGVYDYSRPPDKEIMSKVERRLETFNEHRDWPSVAKRLTQSAQEFSDAGFYYVGKYYYYSFRVFLSYTSL